MGGTRVYRQVEREGSLEKQDREGRKRSASQGSKAPGGPESR